MLTFFDINKNFRNGMVVECVEVSALTNERPIRTYLATYHLYSGFCKKIFNQIDGLNLELLGTPVNY